MPCDGRLGQLERAGQLAQGDRLGHRAEEVQDGGGALDGLDGPGHVRQRYAFDIAERTFDDVERELLATARRSGARCDGRHAGVALGRRTHREEARNPLVGELCAEFAGTLILILFGTGVVAQVVTSADGSLGDHDSIAWAWGIGVTLGVYVAPGSPAATSTRR